MAVEKLGAVQYAPWPEVGLEGGPETQCLGADRVTIDLSLGHTRQRLLAFLPHFVLYISFIPIDNKGQLAHKYAEADVMLKAINTSASYHDNFLHSLAPILSVPSLA